MEKSKLKDNSRKHPYVREQWIKSKRANRPKQKWVQDVPFDVLLAEDESRGHWERVA